MTPRGDSAPLDEASSTSFKTPSPAEKGAEATEELEQLWAEFKSTGSLQARDRLIVHYAPLVKYVTGRVALGIPAGVDQEDLTSAGIVGLMEAITKFEPGRGYKFETYAATRIRGAILDDLRTMDWVPRSVRTQAKRVEDALQKLHSQLGRTPSDDEVAADMGVSVRKLRSIYSRVSRLLSFSLERLIYASEQRGNLTLIETLADSQALDPLGHAESEDMKAFLANAISELPERERTVMTLYYYEGLSFTEIAEVVGLSPARISQMKAKSVLQFRSLMNRAANR